MAAGRCSVHSGVLRGVRAVPVNVEVVVSDGGLPGFAVVGMADAAVQESRERVKAAMKAAGFSMPVGKIVVNLAPSSLRKGGSGFDLAIAVGLLAATGQIPARLAAENLYVGELSLDGGVRPVQGMLAYALCARDSGLPLVCAVDAEGLVEMDGLRQFGLASLSGLRTGEVSELAARCIGAHETGPDYADVYGNEMAKRALQIAAAGCHGVLMMGPPGSGKTMLASRMPSILPPLTPDEMLESALVHSVAGEDTESLLSGQRPFRAPHHTVTAAGLVGGGSPIRPGEISLAHNGVLFLDEFPEARPSVLQQMRQPLEDGYVTLTRADGCVTFPARFMLVAAANPCPCGYFGDPERACSCSAAQVNAYHNRIGGPLMDRIDIHIDVSRVPPGEVLSQRRGTSSAQLREQVVSAREFAAWRCARDDEAGRRGVIAACRLDDADLSFYEQMAKSNSMSGRAIVRTLAVARTIADMSRRERVGRADLCEALGFRVRSGAVA